MREPTEGVRLQKVLSQAGIASRRVAERMIIDGRVEVDGRIVTELGTRVDPDNAVIRVDGARVMLDDALVHLALNKPLGMIRRCPTTRAGRASAISSSTGCAATRTCFMSAASTPTPKGLILLTNDGELAHRLMHPSYEVPKTYLATVTGQVPRGLGKKLREGVELEDGPAQGRRLRDGRRPARTLAGANHACTRAASASCAGCWPRSAFRWRRWCAPTSVRCRWGSSGRAASGADPQRDRRAVQGGGPVSGTSGWSAATDGSDANDRYCERTSSWRSTGRREPESPRCQAHWRGHWTPATSTPARCTGW